MGAHVVFGEQLDRCFRLDAERIWVKPRGAVQVTNDCNPVKTMTCEKDPSGFGRPVDDFVTRL